MSSPSTITQLDIEQLQPNPFQPRGKVHKDELEELTLSIKAHGILEPIVVAETPAGYQIIAGERRWRAGKAAGLTTVPVVIRKTTPRGMLEMALVENVQRSDLSPIERAQAFQQLQRDFNLTRSQLAERIGKSPSFITNSIRLLSLPDAIKDGLVSNSISEGHARAIGAIPDERAMVECYKTILVENASVRRAEELARWYKDQLEPGLVIGVEGDLIVQHTDDQPQIDSARALVKINDAQLKQLEQNFARIFRTRSKVKLQRSNRQTQITITLKGTPAETDSDLQKIIQIADHQ